MSEEWPPIWSICVCVLKIIGLRSPSPLELTDEGGDFAVLRFAQSGTARAGLPSRRCPYHHGCGRARGKNSRGTDMRLDNEMDTGCNFSDRIPAHGRR